MKIKINGTLTDLSFWGIVSLLGVVLTTALQGSGLTTQDITSWTTLFDIIANVVSNPVKIATITLAVVAYFSPKPHKIDNNGSENK